MRSLSILILSTAAMSLMMIVMVEAEAKPATFLVHTADADEPVFKVNSRGGGQIRYLYLARTLVTMHLYLES